MAMLMLNIVSTNKRTVAADRASLGDVAINGLRTVLKDQMKVNGRPHEVPITSGLLLASGEAHRAYAK